MLAKRFFAQTVLLEPAFIINPDTTVGQSLLEHGAEVRAFARYNVGRE
jgi:translation elongation factor EF-Ts